MAQSKALAFLGCVLIIILCVIAYAPVKAQLDSAGFQAFSYGPAVSALWPAFLTGISVTFCVVSIYVSTMKGGTAR